MVFPAEASTFSGSIWAVIREAWCTLESFWTHRVYIYIYLFIQYY